MTRLRPLLLLVIALALGMFADEIGGRQQAEAAFPGDNGELGPLPAGAGMPVVIDNFDDNSLSETVWTPSHMSGTGASMAETNGRVEFHIESDAREGSTPTPGDVLNTVSSGITHNCVLAGDFDIYFDFSMAEWPEENGVRIQFQMAGIGVQRGWDSIFGNFYSTGSHIGAVATTDTSGRLRLARDGTMATASFDAGGSWQAIGSADVGDGPKGFFIRAFSHDHLLDARPEESQDKDITVTIDNLTLAGGTLTCGEKIELTQAIQELETVPDLLEDLDDDGEPPVPIVAGKPLALRVYFDEVDQMATRKVELSGVAERSVNVTLSPGCDIDEQRKQENDCQSADFYFTPPEGEWTASIDVRDGSSGALLSHAEFKVKSVESDSVVLKSVSTCHAIDPSSGSWECEFGSELSGLETLLREVAPTSDVRVVHSGEFVRYDSSTFATGRDWWKKVVADINNLHGFSDSAVDGLLGRESYYFGMVRPPELGGPAGPNGRASGIPGRGAAARSTATAWGTVVTPMTVAHETGHMMGLHHTGVKDPAGFAPPACWQSSNEQPWPYSNNKIQSGPGPNGTVEVGFDVATKKALPGDSNFELMGYCVPRWISPYSYLRMRSPTGPLSVPAVQSGKSEEVFWLVSGFIADSGVTFSPLFLGETDGFSDAGSGLFSIEVRDGGGEALFTRRFTPVRSHPDLPPEMEGEEDEAISFGEYIPFQAGATRIVVLDDDDVEIGAMELTGVAPDVNITELAEASSTGDSVQVAWSVDDPDSAEHTYWVDYSPDGGETWFNQGMGLTDTTLALPVETLPGSDNAVLRVLASDGVNTGTAISEPFSVAKKLPEAEILFPESGQEFDPGDLVWLQGLAFDADDLELDDASIEWSSSRDGVLGTGDDLPVYDLSEGVHTITLTVRDSDDNEATDSITVVVGEGGLKGDVDCDGDVDAVDAQKTLQHVAGLPVAQGPGCPAIGSGEPPFGDVDCDDDVDAVDALSVLRHVAALPVNLPPGCPEIGARRRRRSGSDDQRRAIGVRRAV